MWHFNSKANCLTYPINSENIKEAYEKIQDTTEKLLIELTKSYNQNFGISENKIYYKIVLGRWLFHFISNVYEKLFC